MTPVRVVPIEPTRDQIEAAYVMLSDYVSGEKAQRLCVQLYQTMIEHAPQQRRGGLSQRQRLVHEIVTEFIDKHGISPTYREIAKLAGFSDHSQAWDACRTLKRKGVIGIYQEGDRGIVLILRPEQT